DSAEGDWNSGRDGRPNSGTTIRPREGYLAAPPVDATHDLRNEMMLTMVQCGLRVESQHHEVASGGQGGIDLQHDALVAMADSLLKCKYIIKNGARKHGKAATY